VTLPPGRGPIPVPGIDAGVDPELAKATGELNAWIEYLLHPESHDGPRIYRDLGFGDLDHDSEMPHPSPELDEEPGYQVVSVLDGYAADPGVFFRPAQSISGVSEATIRATYDKMVKGCITWLDTAHHPANIDGSVADIKYPEINPTRLNWMEMRSGWQGKQDLYAHEYEGDFLRYQVLTENAMYVAAEHVVRYLGIFQQAKREITELTNKLTEKFATRPKAGSASADWFSVLITGLTVVAVTVITGGGATAGVTLAEATTEMLGEAVKTGKPATLNGNYHFRDDAKEYLDHVNQIEQDVQHAIEQLYESLRMQIDQIRERRRYEALPQSHTQMTSVPHFKDYVQ
jgi:hypothetical protein